MRPVTPRQACDRRREVEGFHAEHAGDGEQGGQRVVDPERAYGKAIRTSRDTSPEHSWNVVPERS